MMNLYLAPVNSKGEIIYDNYCKRAPGWQLNSISDSIAIKQLTITASIFSPPVVKVICSNDELKLERSSLQHSIFGIVMEEIEIQGTGCGEETHHLTCLFSNRENNYYQLYNTYTQFVITRIEEHGATELCITLMEKHALTLALTHSFACIGQKDSETSSVLPGKLSIAEIVEKLSTISKDGRVLGGGEYEESKPKSIFNFKSSLLHGIRNDEVQSSIQTANYALGSCAFLSRFIAPASQSRLQIISSLMFKYGYGFVYRPLDEQYFAIDLLSMIAPGYECTSVMDIYATAKRCCSYLDRIIFNDSKSGEYFRSYAIIYMTDKADFSGGLSAYDQLLSEYDQLKINTDVPYDYWHYFSHDFTSFYQERFFYYQCSHQLKYHFSTLGSRDYCYLSRYATLGFSACPLQANNELFDNFGFDLSYLSKTPSSINKKYIGGLLFSSVDNLESFFYQNCYHTGQEGASDCCLEDEVEINDISDKRKYNIDEDIKTVNQRLAYARYKLDYMQKNYIEQEFEFKNNNGISRKSNLVYELFQWLGFHTDIFNIIASFYKLTLQESIPPKSSGATRSISSRFSQLDDEGAGDYMFYMLNHLASLTNPTYDFLYNFKDKSINSLFGKLCVKIDCVDDENNRCIYNLTSTLTFYNDITDYNIDPFGWKVKDEQKQVVEQEVEQEEEYDNEEYKNEQEQEQEIKQAKRPKWWLQQRSEDIIEEDEGLNNEPSYQAQSQHSDPRHESRIPALRNHQASRLPGGGSAVDLFNNSLFSLRNYDPESPAGIIHRSLIFDNSGLENTDENNLPDIADLLEGGRRLDKGPQ